MGLPQQKSSFDAAAYLEWEETQVERHEFIAGEVFAMVGARLDHNKIALNLAASLKAQLRGRPCRTFIETAKLRLETADAFLYPDVFVTCDARDRGPEAVAAARYPSFIAEVLSDSTSAYDRGRKFELYQQIDKLQEYLLIEQDRVHADLFRKNAEGLWVLHPYGPGATVRLASVDLALPIETLYEDVEFPTAPA